MSKPAVQLFEQQQVRSVRDEEHEKWWFSILDIITILIDQPDYKKVRNYRKWLKNKLLQEGSELVSNTNQLKLLASDAEATTTELSKKKQPKTWDDNMQVAKDGGQVAGNARKEIESRLGETVISPLNAKERKKLTGN